jgi:hypothetical protein
MCVQALLAVSQPSVCCLVPFFKSVSAILQSTCCCWTDATITKQNMRINILESSDLAKPEELIMYKSVFRSCLFVKSPFNQVYLQQNKKGQKPSLGKKCHAKTMMNRKADKTLKYTPSMCRLDRTRRKKDEGRG